MSSDYFDGECSAAELIGELKAENDDFWRHALDIGDVPPPLSPQIFRITGLHQPEPQQTPPQNEIPLSARALRGDFIFQQPQIPFNHGLPAQQLAYPPPAPLEGPNISINAFQINLVVQHPWIWLSPPHMFSSTGPALMPIPRPANHRACNLPPGFFNNHLHNFTGPTHAYASIPAYPPPIHALLNQHMIPFLPTPTNYLIQQDPLEVLINYHNNLARTRMASS